jgi:hypothetical protein
MVGIEILLEYFNVTTRDYSVKVKIKLPLYNPWEWIYSTTLSHLWHWMETSD